MSAISNIDKIYPTEELQLAATTMKMVKKLHLVLTYSLVSVALLIHYFMLFHHDGDASVVNFIPDRGDFGAGWLRGGREIDDGGWNPSDGWYDEESRRLERPSVAREKKKLEQEKRAAEVSV